MSQDQNDTELPILKVKEQLIKQVENNPILVVTGDTGSGKSTQISQFLYQRGYRKIAITQPRRVGAISLASRVSKEMGCSLGKDVGYAVRFDDCSSRETRIKYLTDGCLLRECLSDKDLKHYDAIVLDEAHERSLQTDILFGLLLKMAEKRATKRSTLRYKKDGKVSGEIGHKKMPFRLIITSATLNTEKFCGFFKCPSFHIPGRCFPVEIRNVDDAPRSYATAAVETALAIHLKEPADGHVLVFLTGREEIEDCCEMLGRKVDALIDSGVELPDIAILPAYSTLRACEQEKIFYKAPKNCRKVVFATNIAETSLTVSGIRFVIDAGFVKQKIFNERTGIDSLVVVPISKVAASQRAGRAGRTCPGVCYRLYSAENFSQMAEEAQPEIQRSSLPGVLLLLKALGVSDPLGFPFIDPPRREVAIDGLRTLFLLGALDACGEVTRLGKGMARLPLDPGLAKLLLCAAKFDCSQKMLTIAAMLSAEKLWAHYPDKERILQRNRSREAMGSSAGDPFALANVYIAWEKSGFRQRWSEANHLNYWSLVRAKRVREQLGQIVEEMKRDERLMDAVKSVVFAESGKDFIDSSKDDVKTRCRKILANVFFMNTCRLLQDDKRGKIYRPIENGKGGVSLERGPQVYWMHKSSCLSENPPEWLVYDHVMFTSKPYLQHVTKIDFEWVVNLVDKLKQVDLKKLSSKGVNRSSGQSLKGRNGYVSRKIENTVNRPIGKEEKVKEALQRFLDRKKEKAKRKRQ